MAVGGREFGPKITAFLAAIRVTPIITRAAAAAGVDPSLHYRKMKTSRRYAAAFQTALDIGFDAVSDFAVERSTYGWDEPLVYEGDFCYPKKWNKTRNRFEPDTKKPPLTVRKIDNKLLQFVLESRHKEYRERVEHSGGMSVTLVERLHAGRKRVAEARAGQVQP